MEPMSWRPLFGARFIPRELKLKNRFTPPRMKARRLIIDQTPPPPPPSGSICYCVLIRSAAVSVGFRCNLNVLSEVANRD